MEEEETLHPHEILRQNLKYAHKLMTKDGQIKKKVAKQFTEHKCKICNKTFTDKSNLVSHEKIHGPATFQCPECPYKGKTKKYLTRHRKKTHSEPTAHKCYVCGKMFHYQSKMREHMMVHTGEKPHKCDVCGKAFRVTFSLNAHMLIHRNEKPFKCVFCDFACRDSSSLKKHENRHMGVVKEYPCQLCPKKFPERAKLRYHISRYHLDCLDLEQGYSCGDCGTKVKSKYNLKKHIEAVHGDSLRCKCPVCGKKVSNKYNLPAHLRSHFTERPYSCSFNDCNKSFKDKGSLKKHAIIHQPHLHHACRQCGATFSRPRRLVAHMRVHEPRTKSVQCDHCGVKFYTKNYLIKHITQKHTRNKKKFTCDYCGLETYNKPSIVMHLKYGHCDVDDLRCKICKTKYKLYQYLKSHYLKTHNIRYRPMKKRSSKVRKKRKPTVEIKMEPLDPDELFEEEIHIIDVPKEEILEEDPNLDNDSVTYSRQVLSEDLADCLMEDREKTENTECNFDAFLFKHVFNKQVKQEEQILQIDEEQRSYVDEQVKEIIKVSRETQLVEKREKQASVLERKREQQDTLIVSNELRHKAERKGRQQSDELKEERQMHDQKTAIIGNVKDTTKEVKNLHNKTTEKVYTKNQTVDSNSSHAGINKYDNNDSVDDVLHHENDSLNDTIEGEAICDDDVYNNVRIDSTDENNIELNEMKRSSSTIPDEELNNHRNNGTTNANDENDSTDHMNNVHDDENEIDAGSDHNSDSSDDDFGDVERKKRLEIQELDKVRQMYNQRVKVAAEMGRKRQPEKAIKYYKQKTTDESPADKHTNKATDKESSKLTNVSYDINNSSVTNKDVGASNPVAGNSKQTGLSDECIDENEGVVHTNDKIITFDEANRSVDNNEPNDSTYDENANNDSVNDCNANEDSNDDESDDGNGKSDDDSDYEPSLGKESTGNKKLKFKTHQCYVCFKLYTNKKDLMSHCEGHFAICNTTTLAKCPCCGYVTSHRMAHHMWNKHQIRLRIPYTKITQREDSVAGSKYCYRMDKEGNLMEIIPSVKMLNHDAAIRIDRKNRERKDTIIAKTKLVRRGREWVVENEAVDVCYNQLPEFTEQELRKLKVSTNYVDRLGQLGKLAKKKGVKMVFPCNGCDKICQNFSGLKLHSRRHDPNKKPFAPKQFSYNQWKQKRARPAALKKPEEKNNSQSRLDNRFAKPKPIKNNHKCDVKLKEFYETHIRGADIEFWQFLKIFNKMGRENIQDFKDFEGRTDFGHHGYLDENFKDPLNSETVAESAQDAKITQRNVKVTKRNRQSETIAEGTRQSGKIAEGTLQSGKIAKGIRHSGKIAEGTRQSGKIAEGIRPSGTIAEGTRQSEITYRSQRNDKIIAPKALSSPEWMSKERKNIKSKSAKLKMHNNNLRKPYVRVIMISRKQHLAREQAKVRLREKFSKKDG